jgi:hypothetical protein
MAVRQILIRGGAPGVERGVSERSFTGRRRVDCQGGGGYGAMEVFGGRHPELGGETEGAEERERDGVATRRAD